MLICAEPKKYQIVKIFILLDYSVSGKYFEHFSDLMPAKLKVWSVLFEALWCCETSSFFFCKYCSVNIEWTEKFMKMSKKSKKMLGNNEKWGKSWVIW